MKGVFKTSALLILSVLFFAFTMNGDSTSNYGISVSKSITQVAENVFQVTIKVENGNEVNGIAKYEAKLPLSADFLKEVKKDKTISMKLDGRKIKLLWLHIQKNQTYTTTFQISSKKKVESLEMAGKVFGHKNGERFSFEENSAFIQF